MKAVQILAARSATAATRATNTLRTSTCRFSTVTRSITRTTAIPLRTNYRSFSNSRVAALTLSPTSSDPEPPKTEDHGSGIQAAELTDSEYHEISDQYMNSLVLTLEELADGDKGGEVVEVEYSVSLQDRYRNHTDFAGRSSHSRSSQERHICPEQTASEQTDLAFESCLGS